MDKQEILDDVIAHLQKRYDSIIGSAEDTALQASSQDGPMQSRYDTMRTEGSWLADGLHIRAQELEAELRRAKLYKLPESEMEGVVEGALVNVRLPTGTKVNYLILPFAGGFKETYDEEKILVVTSQAPIVDPMWGKKAGDTFIWEKRRYHVQQVR